MEIEGTGTNASYMFPARQHTTGLQDKDMPLVTQTLKNVNSMDTSYAPRALPLMMLDCPHILSEAGNMFIYRTCWDFKCTCTLHTLPPAINELSFAKAIIPYPQAKIITDPTSNITKYQYFAVP
jgi:hypothetical protein